MKVSQESSKFTWKIVVLVRRQNPRSTKQWLLISTSLTASSRYVTTALLHNSLSHFSLCTTKAEAGKNCESTRASISPGGTISNKWQRRSGGRLPILSGLPCGIVYTQAQSSPQILIHRKNQHSISFSWLVHTQASKTNLMRRLVTTKSVQWGRRCFSTSSSCVSSPSQQYTHISRTQLHHVYISYVFREITRSIVLAETSYRKIWEGFWDRLQQYYCSSIWPATKLLRPLFLFEKNGNNMSSDKYRIEN